MDATTIRLSDEDRANINRIVATGAASNVSEAIRVALAQTAELGSRMAAIERKLGWAAEPLSQLRKLANAGNLAAKEELERRGFILDGGEWVEKREDEVSRETRSLRGMVIDAWKAAGRPRWELGRTVRAALSADEDLEKRGLNPAPTFRKHRKQQDQASISTWTNGCRFEWLSPTVMRDVVADTRTPNIAGSSAMPIFDKETGKDPLEYPKSRNRLDSLRGRVRHKFKLSGEASWDIDQLVRALEESDDELAEEGLDPAPTIRASRLRGDRKHMVAYAKFWKFPWLRK